MRILIRTSKWAIWARRLGSFAVPMTVIPILLHRERLLASATFSTVMAIAALLALAAVFVAIVALGRLWRTGDLGWGKAFAGLFLGLLCLAPFGWYGYLGATTPAVTDIATAERGLMPLVFEPGTADMPPPKLLSAADIEARYPNAKTRTYPLDAQQTYAIVLRMIEERGWDIRLQRPPATGTSIGRINAQVVTLPGWREEAVLRIAGGPEGASVDMRSASLNALYDFGSNGERIEAFMMALDNEITVLLRDNPNANQPVEAEPEAPVDPVAGGN
ncbi:hypothetical protein VW29_17045 [Devosia limi DSM 17137]|uniref:DUF1499 domain-containing protein n=1 Tax=Devosia limi DSM 17137 TaxID=1121477 RepID=A0A0F5LEC3_9HYPH|nr:DUF1499 domain-containing protein [Devosia limi]KKB80703.1 hypothetical protein VW29_17045 [Devosia limi DSM 17137]SHE47375.1 Protein of unknown function [Devosia limi DSM 17137]